MLQRRRSRTSTTRNEPIVTADTQVDGFRPQREHMLGMMAIGALTGASVCAGFLGRPNVAAVLGAGAVGVTAGTLAGHVAWDQYLARVEHRPRPSSSAPNRS